MAARYASVYSSVWSDLAGLSDKCKLLLLYLASSPHSTILNADRQPVGYIIEDLEWTQEEIEETLNLLEEKGWIAWDPVTSEVAILYVPLRNLIRSITQVKAAKKIATGIKSEKIAETVHQILLKTLSVTDESTEALLNTLYDRASIPYQQDFVQKQKQKQRQKQKLNKNQDQNPKKGKESDLASEKKNREREEIEARCRVEV